jgi:hypothetical protein
MNLGVLAPTSTGKSYPITQSVDFTPRGKEVRVVGSMTPKVLIREQGVLIDKEGNPIGKEVRKLKNAISAARSKKNYDAAEQYYEELAALLEDSAYLIELFGKTLIFLEPPHPELWGLLKPILSHDYWEMEHSYVDKIAGGGLEVKRIITHGFPACIFCSAKDESKWEMWDEIKSRFQIESPNMIQPKYQAGNKLIGQNKGLPRGVKQQIIISDTEKELGRQCFLYLKHQIQQCTSTTDSPVWIPFCERLAEILPAEKGQDNRATNRFFTMLNMIALSKAHLRYRLLFDDEELIIATLGDLQEALHIMQNMSGLPPHKLKFYKQYVLPLYQTRKGPLQTREICDYYNIHKPKGTPKMNSNNLLKSYLYELANHNYLEQEQDENTKAVRYLFTPLMDLDEEQEEKEKEEEQETGKKQSSTPSTLSPVYHKLQFSKLILPENHMGIPKDWLKQEILQLSSRTLTKAPLKILDPKGNDVPIDDFITYYESEEEQGLKFKDFFKEPSLVYRSESTEITTSEPEKVGGDVNTTNKDEKEDEKRYTEPKVYRVDDGPPVVVVDELINAAMRDRGYFTEYELEFRLNILPVQDKKIHDNKSAKEIIEELLERGKLVEIEPGKYKPAVNDGEREGF